LDNRIIEYEVYKPGETPRKGSHKLIAIRTVKVTEYKIKSINN